MDEFSIATSPKIYLFNETEDKALQEFLADVDRHTMILPINSPADLILDSECRTVRGYRYTTIALNQLCRALASGLAYLLPDVAGMYRKPNSDPRDYSLETSTEFLAKLIRLRFNRHLQTLQLVCNTQTKLIDGIVGVRYRYLSNNDFNQRAALTVRERRSSSFVEGGLYGRHLYLRYKWPDTTFEVQEGDTYAMGIHFANSEIGGSAVRAAISLIRSNGECALGQFSGNSGGRVIHSGADFEKRLSGLLGNIFIKMKRKEVYKELFDKLQGHNLQLSSLGDQRRLHRLSVSLGRKKLTQAFTRRVISSALAKGSSGEDRLADELPEDVALIIKQRTVYDLFTALMREARTLPLGHREQAEHVAYSLVMGLFTVD